MACEIKLVRASTGRPGSIRATAQAGTCAFWA